MHADLMRLMYAYAMEAGAISLEEMENASGRLKADESFVTHVDLKLSELAVSMFSSCIPPGCIITEEHLEHYLTLPDDPPAETDEIPVVVDPLDGTRNYVHSIPLYGISVGVLKNRRPWLGLVAFPGIDEIITCDGEATYFITGTYRGKPQKKRVNSAPYEITKNSILLGCTGFLRDHEWDYNSGQIVQTGCASMNLCWTAVGRAAATVFGNRLWDIAGSWPILLNTGFVIKGLESGRDLTEFSRDLCDPVSHNLRELHLVCRPEHYDVITASSAPRSS